MEDPGYASAKHEHALLMPSPDVQQNIYNIIELEGKILKLFVSICMELM